jgi:hypothetical protein
MAGKRVFLLERDRIEAGAVASLIEQCGHRLAGVAHGLEDAAKLRVEALDFALLERDLGDGTDATPIAELLSEAGVPYAFIIQSGDRVDPTLFPGAAFLRKPLTAQSLEAVFERAEGDPPERWPARDQDAARVAEIDMIKSKLQQTAVQAGPPAATQEKAD